MLVRFAYLKAEGILNDYVDLHRKIEKHGFPKAIELGPNKLAWDLDEVRAWLASRPRRVPNNPGLGKLSLPRAVAVLDEQESAIMTEAT